MDNRFHKFQNLLTRQYNVLFFWMGKYQIAISNNKCYCLARAVFFHWDVDIKWCILQVDLTQDQNYISMIFLFIWDRSHRDQDDMKQLFSWIHCHRLMQNLCTAWVRTLTRSNEGMKKGDSQTHVQKNWGGVGCALGWRSCITWKLSVFIIHGWTGYCIQLSKSQGPWCTADKEAGLGNSLGALCRGALCRA